jgi:integrase
MVKSPVMASIRPGKRKDQTPYWSVLYRLDGRQCSTSFNVERDADRFKLLVESAGAERARDAIGVAPPKAHEGLSVTEWLNLYIGHLTGVQRDTVERYRAYVKRDIGPNLGSLPLTVLSRDDIAAWINQMEADDDNAKTIKNKHGFLSAAMKGAVAAGHIGTNPCERVRLPRWDRKEMVFLTREDFAKVHAVLAEHWRPLVSFLVSSGCRFGEATALRPADIDRDNHTVRIVRAWKYHSGGYEIGVPKTKRSVRTINIPPSVLDQLDYSGEWLFVSRSGGPVRITGFNPRVWKPAVAKAELDPRPRVHDLRHTAASWLIAAGIPLPVIQRRLGHESITTTVDLYGHLDRRSDAAAAEAISALLGPETPKDSET